MRWLFLEIGMDKLLSKVFCKHNLMNFYLAKTTDNYVDKGMIDNVHLNGIKYKINHCNVILTWRD